MQGYPNRSPAPERRGQWLLALMVIAATAVIVLSLFGVARMTGVIPRVGVDQHETDAARDKVPGAVPREREERVPESQEPAPSSTPGSRSPRRIVLVLAGAGDAVPSGYHGLQAHPEANAVAWRAHASADAGTNAAAA